MAKLLELAFCEGLGVNANRLISEVRQRVHAQRGSAVNYEVVLTNRGWDHILEVVAPRLALYMHEKRLSPLHRGPLFLSLFFDQSIYFLEAQEFFCYVQRTEMLDDEAFSARLRLWQSTGRPAAGALPPRSFHE